MMVMMIVMGDDDGDGDDDGNDGEERCLKYTEFSAGKLFYTSR